MDTNVPQGGQQEGQQGESNGSQQQSNAGSAQNDPKAEVKGLINQLEALLDEYMVKKAPFQIPMGGKEFIVKIAPYLIIIFAILAVPAILAALGLSAFLTPFAMIGGYGWGLGAMISLAVSVVALVIEVMAVPGLFKRTRGGWRLVFYATIISLIGSILSFNIIGGIIGAIIGWYILFQVKELYKN